MSDTREPISNDFCRSCRGEGKVSDVLNSMEEFGTTTCRDCAGTGWRNPPPPAPRRILSIWDHEIIRTEQ